MRWHRNCDKQFTKNTKKKYAISSHETTKWHNRDRENSIAFACYGNNA